MTVTRNRFSSSSFMAPLIDPIAQHKVLRLFHVKLFPETCQCHYHHSITPSQPAKQGEGGEDRRDASVVMTHNTTVLATKT